MHLVDVNILIARADRSHVHHRVVARWFADAKASAWATCPIVQNAFLRILGRPSYPNGPGNPEKAAFMLRELLKIPGHRFVPDDVSSRLTD